MPRLPIPGQDTDQWGALLNEFLNVAHRSNGTLRNICDVTNVLDFGAAPNGQTDNTVAFQTAIAAAGIGGVVFVPPGTYVTGKLLLPSNITIAGTGSSSILILKDGTSDALFTNQDWENGNSHIVIHDLRLEGNRDHNPEPDVHPPCHRSTDNGPSHGIHFRYVSHCVIERMYIADFYFDGIYLGTSEPDRYSESHPNLSDGSNLNTIRGNRIAGNGRNGISITRGNDNAIVNNILIENNKGILTWVPPVPNAVNPFRAGAIDLEVNGAWYELKRTIVSGNHLINNYYNAIQVVPGWESKGTLLTSNVISGNQRHGIAACGAGIIIQGNYVASNSGCGMALGLGTGVKDTVVTGNLLYANQGQGILLNGDQGEHVVVSGNICTANVSGGIVWSWIIDTNVTPPRPEDAPKQVVITGNITLAALGGPEQIIADGADPVFAANLIGPLGVAGMDPATQPHRIIRSDSFFGQHWRMYADDSSLYVENLRTGESFRVQLEALAVTTS